MKHYFICAVYLSLNFESGLLAQQPGNHAWLSGRAVRSHRTPGLSSVRRTKLNNQVINGVLKQNTPTKARQTQITGIQKRLSLRLPPFVIADAKGSASRLDKIWYPFWYNGTGGHYGNIIWLHKGWINWLPK
jgi:hypothetical protein